MAVTVIRLGEDDDYSAFSAFDCHYSDGYNVAPRLEREVQDLATFLCTRARDALINKLSVPYVVYLDEERKELAGFFALAASSIRFTDDEKNDDKGLGELNKKQFRQFPAIKIVQLAVATRYQGRGSGGIGDKIFEAISTIANLTFEHVGVRFIIMDALADIRTIKFYKRIGFKPHYDDENLKAYNEILDGSYENKPHKRLKSSISMYIDITK